MRSKLCVNFALQIANYGATGFNLRSKITQHHRLLFTLQAKSLQFVRGYLFTVYNSNQLLKW